MSTTTFRKANVVMTLMMTADVETNDETGQSNVVLLNVGNTVMASFVAQQGASEASAEFKNAVASAIVKGGLNFMVNDLEGKHEGKPPAINQPGADA